MGIALDMQDAAAGGFARWQFRDGKERFLSRNIRWSITTKLHSSSYQLCTIDCFMSIVLC